MSILFAGSEPGDFVIPSGGVSASSSSTTNYDPTYVRRAVQIGGGTIQAGFVASSEVWSKFTFLATSHSGNTTDSVLALLSAAGVGVARLVGTGTSGQMQVQRWDGAAWVNVGAPFTYAINTTYTLILRARTEANGLVEFYVAGALHASWTGDAAALGNIDTLTLGTLSNIASVLSRISEVIVATHSIFSTRLKALAITGAGDVNEWTGLHTDLNAYDSPDESFLASDTAEQKALFTKNGLAADTLNVDAVILSGRFRQGATGPSNIDAIMRVGGIDYAENVGNLGDAFAPHQVIFAVDPATAAPWTREAVEAAQIGLQSKV